MLTRRMAATVHETAGGPSYPDDYFSTGNYADRPLGRFSMYWFARRYFAALVRRLAPAGGHERRLLEVGCGLGHLLGLLQNDFSCNGIDLIPGAVTEARRVAPRAHIGVGNAEEARHFPAATFHVIVSLHVVEHLVAPQEMLVRAFASLVPGGLLLFATPHPEYALRRWKDRTRDAIGKDPTHINCQTPDVWRGWCTAAGFRVERHFGDGLWDVPYLPVVPAPVQLAVLGLPALAQVLTRGTWMPRALGVNQVVVARKGGEGRPLTSLRLGS